VQSFDEAKRHLAERAREVVEIVWHRINDPRTPEKRAEYPYNAPSAADFLELMGLEIEREMLAAQIEIVSSYSKSHAYVMQHRLTEIGWEIATRDEKKGGGGE
jgi:hypothetical protein